MHLHLLNRILQDIKPRRRPATKRGIVMKKLGLILVVAISFLMVFTAFAKEGGDQYPNGVENWFAGAAPPPGFYYANYFGYYTGELKNGTGQNVVLNGTTPSVSATFNAFRFVDITKFKILGADYGMPVIVPVVHQTMNLNGQASNSSIGDITIAPFLLGWHRPRWHAAAGFDINLPTGHFDQNDPRVSMYQVHSGGGAEHQGSNLHRADAAFEIQLVRERATGELGRGNV